MVCWTLASCQGTSYLTDVGIGDIVYLKALGQHIIILSSEEVAQDLLVQRSTIYSSRPVPTMSGIL